jgi:hypothetical protein
MPRIAALKRAYNSILQDQIFEHVHGQTPIHPHHASLLKSSIKQVFCCGAWVPCASFSLSTPILRMKLSIDLGSSRLGGRRPRGQEGGRRRAPLPGSGRRRQEVATRRAAAARRTGPETGVGNSEKHGLPTHTETASNAARPSRQQGQGSAGAQCSMNFGCRPASAQPPMPGSVRSSAARAATAAAAVSPLAMGLWVFAARASRKRAKRIDRRPTNR